MYLGAGNAYMQEVAESLDLGRADGVSATPGGG